MSATTSEPTPSFAVSEPALVLPPDWKPAMVLPRGPVQRRRHCRMKLLVPATICRVGDAHLISAAELLDFSSSGIGLRTDTDFAVGTTVLIRWDGLHLIGAVRHCTDTDSGCVIGVELEPLASTRHSLSQMRALLRMRYAS